MIRTAIDVMSHENTATLMLKGVGELEKVGAAALEYAQQANDTLVIVTADYDCGGLTVESLDNSEFPDESGGEGDAAISAADGPFPIADAGYGYVCGYGFTPTGPRPGHTGVPVPVSATGPGSELLAGIYENTHLLVAMATALGLEVPAGIPGTPVPDATPVSSATGRRRQSAPEDSGRDKAALTATKQDAAARHALCIASATEASSLAIVGGRMHGRWRSRWRRLGQAATLAAVLAVLAHAALMATGPHSARASMAHAEQPSSQNQRKLAVDRGHAHPPGEAPDRHPSCGPIFAVVWPSTLDASVSVGVASLPVEPVESTLLATTLRGHPPGPIDLFGTRRALLQIYRL